MGDRDEIFANFQACTGIEDVEHCIAVLEQNNWDLSQAIASVFDDAPNNQNLIFDEAAHIENHKFSESLDIVGDSIAIQQLNEDMPANDLSASPISQSPSNQKRIRMVGFDVEWRGQIYPIVLPDTDTIGTIKNCLASQLHLDPNNIKFHGFKVPCADWTIIRHLHLPKENHITMTVFGEDGKASTASTSAAASNFVSENSDEKNMLDIHVKDMQTGRIYPLKQSFNKTFAQLKQDLFSLTNIPTSRQIWSGSLANVSPDSFLVDCGLSKELNYYELRDSSSVSSCVATTSQPQSLSKDVENNKGEPESSTKNIVDNSMSCDEEDNFDYPLFYENDIENMRNYIDNVRDNVQQLMPDNIDNEVSAIENFRTVFQNRYAGSCGLGFPFLVSSLDEAVQSITETPAHQRKPLFLYLHHDRSILANIFCSQVLCSSQLVLFFLENDYSMWPWDLTHSFNKSNLIVSLTKHLGSVEANRINQMRVDSFPVILMLSNLEYGNLQILGSISGSCTLEEVMDQLWILKSRYSDLQAPHVSQAIEREQREEFRKEQYAAYLESLRLDQERDRQRELENNREEEERRKAELVQEARELRFLEAKSRIPDEPDDVADRTSVACIKFRLPNGEQKMRRFAALHTLQNLIDYVESLGFPREETKIITTYPRKDLASLEDITLTMSALKLVPQETLTLETR